MKHINPQTGRPFYYKDNPEAVKLRDSRRMYLDGSEVSKKHPLHKPGKYSSFEDAAFSSLGTYATRKEGYVYIVSNPAWDGWFKVGKAVDADDRCKSYNTSSPLRDFKVEYKIYVEDRNKSEKVAHTKALKQAEEYTGEWFRISLNSLKDILNSLAVLEIEYEENQLVQQSFNF